MTSSAYLRLLIFLLVILIPACPSSSPAFLMMYSANNLNKQGDQKTALTYSFPKLEPVCCSMTSSNFCFLTCIQISQESGQVVWYFHLFQNFPLSVAIYTVKGFGIVTKAEVDFFFFLKLSCFLMIQQMLTILSLVPLPFLNPA